MNDDPFPIPAEIQSILDEASIEDGHYSARPTETSIQLVDTRDGRIVREAQWENAGQFARNILRNCLGAVPTENVMVRPLSDDVSPRGLTPPNA